MKFWGRSPVYTNCALNPRSYFRMLFPYSMRFIIFIFFMRIILLEIGYFHENTSENESS